VGARTILEGVEITLKVEDRCERTTLEGVGITLKKERGVKEQHWRVLG
jgi:hypothetical protein